MNAIRQFLRSDRAAAASEFVLAMPIMLVLIFVAMEAGNYFWNEQKLIQAVRDGARYAARLDYTTVCDANFATGTANTRIRNVIRTGRPDGVGYTRLPIWDETKVTVTPNCGAFVSTGIYTGLGSAGAIISVSAVGMPYRSILGTLGFSAGSVALAASENSPVIGA